jgi:hypothetical protein
MAAILLQFLQKLERREVVPLLQQEVHHAVAQRRPPLFRGASARSLHLSSGSGGPTSIVAVQLAGGRRVTCGVRADLADGKGRPLFLPVFGCKVKRGLTGANVPPPPRGTWTWVEAAACVADPDSGVAKEAACVAEGSTAGRDAGSEQRSNRALLNEAAACVVTSRGLEPQRQIQAHCRVLITAKTRPKWQRPQKWSPLRLST